ncbi:phage portal protein [Arcobacter arenosus]|uniref:Phage portal protein n=1 Tax=Arcobacter arenosus TaxID=2576037 RepID=A0A5R8Y4Q6_9BACT|nr:phage portal protein [Arcobacter arenosus]TLP41046.1 phage portal protein [Arcobacter arenosus]
MNLNPFNWFRSQEVATSSQEFSELFAPRESTSGENITLSNAMKISTVFSCIRVLSETTGSLPIHLYEYNSKNNKKSKAYTHNLYDILNLEPNKDMTSVTFWEVCIAHLCLNGNFYAQIIKSRAGKILELVPLLATNVTKYRLEDDSIIFTYNNGKHTYEFKQDEIFEVIGFSKDGWSGMSPIEYQRDSLGLSKSAENYGSRFFKNNATPPIAVKIPQTLNDEQYKRLKKSWQKAHSGENAHKVALLEGGADITSIGLSNSDSQFLETRQFQKSEICGMYRVPPHLVADLSKSSFNNISEQSQELVKYTLQPYINRIEKSIKKQLLSKEERKKYYAKFNVDGLLRGDIQSRFNAYNIGRNMGVYSANEIREKEDMNPIKDGDTYLVPLNMTEQKDNNEAE